MDTYPTVSIIVPVFNAQMRLNATLHSLAQQTYIPIEIVLVDDGSTDDSGSLADAFAESRNQVRVLHTSNCGAYAARESGSEIATGEYITFCDAGDTLCTYAIEAMVLSALESSADIVVAAFNRIIDGKPRREMAGFGNNAFTVNSHSGFLTSINTSLWAKLFTRKVFEHRIQLEHAPRIGEDALVLYSLYPYIEKIAFIDEPLYNYYVEHESAMSSMELQDFYGMHHAWLQLRKVTGAVSTGTTQIVDLAAMMHLGVSAPLAMQNSSSPSHAQVKACARLAKDALDQGFPNYKDSAFVKRDYVTRYPTMRKIALMHTLVSRNMVPSALRLLHIFRTAFNVNIGW